MYGCLWNLFMAETGHMGLDSGSYKNTAFRWLTEEETLTNIQNNFSYLVEITVGMPVMVLFVGEGAVQPLVDTGALVTGGGYTFAPMPIHRPMANPTNSPMYTPCWNNNNKKSGEKVIPQCLWSVKSASQYCLGNNETVRRFYCPVFYIKRLL